MFKFAYFASNLQQSDKPKSGWAARCGCWAAISQALNDMLISNISRTVISRAIKFPPGLLVYLAI